jgi:hypothetical protein
LLEEVVQCLLRVVDLSGGCLAEGERRCSVPEWGWSGEAGDVAVEAEELVAVSVVEPEEEVACCARSRRAVEEDASRGHSGLRKLLVGSVTAELLSSRPVLVLVVQDS